MPSTDDPAIDDRATDDPSTGDRFPYGLVGIAILATLVLLYGTLIATQALAALGLAIPIVALYLLWRFVRAHERIAAAVG